MKLLASIFGKKNQSQPRRRVNIYTVEVLVANAIAAYKQPNHKQVWTKQEMSYATRQDIEEASAKSYAPWKKNVWECEDQARSLVEAAQRKAANAGCSIAIGVLFADAMRGGDGVSRHVYIIAILDKGEVVFFDPTARCWTLCPSNVYFFMI